MEKYLLRNVRIVNEGTITPGDVLLEGGRISRIGPVLPATGGVIEIDGKGKYLLPGVIDDQVHFREPGLTHKATIRTESRAAVAGGVTSFMEMPNTIPNALTQELLEEKYALGAVHSVAN
jgi:dihydroorotase